MLVAFVFSFLALAGPVLAHSDLKESRPLGGQTVRDSIDHVDLVFWSAFSDPAVDVVGPDGMLIAGRASEVDDHTVRFTMEPLVHEGEYLVRWEILADDGDLSDGAFAFTFTPTGKARTFPGLLAAAAAAAIALLWWIGARYRRSPPS